MNHISKEIVLAALGLTVCCGPITAQYFSDKASIFGFTPVVSGSGNGSGLSTYDFDKDGLDDISITSNVGELKFYHNTGLGFELLQLGVLSAGFTEHLLWVDIDNDSDLDIYFTTSEGQQFLYKNVGNFLFEEATESSGLPTYNAWYSGASFGDYDLDGDLDLYTCKYNLSPIDPADISQYNKLFQNQGDGTFIDVTIDAGVFKGPTFSFQSTWLDYDDDGWPDLHVINDRNPVNFFFHNNGDGTFTEIADELNISFPGEDPMSNSVSDFDHDGDLDIYMTNTGEITGNSHNFLLVNNSEGGFDEMAAEFGVDPLLFGWGALWIDADNDTWKDIIFTTQNSNPLHYYKSVAGESFIQSNELIYVEENITSYCPSSGDFNNDGYADIAIQNEIGYLPYVLINEGGDNHFIKITLEGTISNKQAIGSWVKVYANNSVYTEYTLCGENYLGQNSQNLIFGLGPDILYVDSVIVKYPSRHIDTFYTLPIDSSYHFVEGETYICEITSEYQDFAFCAGDSILIDAGEHANYIWNTGDTTQTIWANNATSYVVTTQNEFGLTAFDSIVVTQFQNPLISAALSHPECHGDSTGSITIINQLGILPESVTWNIDQTGTAIDSVPAGIYSYYYTDTLGCISEGDVILTEPSAMEFFAICTPETSGNVDGCITIFVFGGTPPYQILLNNIEVENSISSLAAGDYTFEILDNNLCKDSLTVTIGVITGINEHKIENAEIFPNPASGFIRVNTNYIYTEINILNLKGETVMSLYPNSENKYDVSGLTRGIYIVELVFSSESMAHQKMVKL